MDQPGIRMRQPRPCRPCSDLGQGRLLPPGKVGCFSREENRPTEVHPMKRWYLFLTSATLAWVLLNANAGRADEIIHAGCAGHGYGTGGFAGYPPPLPVYAGLYPLPFPYDWGYRDAYFA